MVVELVLKLQFILLMASKQIEHLLQIFPKTKPVFRAGYSNGK